ncbi:hypothetical protein LB523_10505 [Mesorhizobium sp. ESP-6-4]|uniref:hypothetical protein n=1 Tax=Mesorhizobium sp. ESP-6-4 TaxID=2876624 RepID=UPI001CD0030E|nr:hypothetical protein [Mesorhizobium sp. ESP-6-4]MBZ9659476.1 hypothetical protein [Mesorhizobium sp. ESP-6-4]
MADIKVPFTTKQGKQVLIVFDDMGERVAIYAKVNGSDQQVGTFEFDHSPEGDGLLMTLADINPDYKRQGVGQKVLEEVTRQTGQEIWARDFDGIKRDDGSHLTGDAPPFVQAMKEKGLILKSAADYPDPPHDDYDR